MLGAEIKTKYFSNQARGLTGELLFPLFARFPSDTLNSLFLSTFT